MFINPIRSLDKTRFGINFKLEDIKCKSENVFKKEDDKEKNVDKNSK